MPLPEGFSEWEHLQSTLMRTHNRLVYNEFSDLGDDAWDPDITTPRSSLRTACTLKDNDTSSMALLRLYLFYTVVRGGRDNWPEIYGIPSTEFQEIITFLPQVRLWFSEDYSAVPDGQSPVRAWLSFRVMNETSQTYNESKARTLANKINSEFSVSGGYRWRKGSYLCSYVDHHKGYHTQVLAISEAEGKEVIRKMLSVNGDTLDEEKFSLSTKNKPSVNNPGNHSVYGKSVRKYRYRPTAYVRFRYAELNLHGLPTPITLVDTTGRRRNPLVTAR